MKGSWKRVLWFALALALVALAVFRPGADTNQEAVWAEDAQQALEPFKGQLMAALQQGLAGSPKSAIDACRLEAPRIAASINSATLRVGRTSHRLRNPGNLPKPWMRPVLETFLAAAPGEIAYRTVPLTDGWVGYAEAIYVQPLCLTCHGDKIAAPLVEHIRSEYPNDQATGFQTGDFRGLFWVELKTQN